MPKPIIPDSQKGRKVIQDKECPYKSAGYCYGRSCHFWDLGNNCCCQLTIAKSLERIAIALEGKG